MTIQSSRQALVSPEWVEAHRTDPAVRLIQVDRDPAAYWRGHIPEALAWSPRTQLSDPARREIVGREPLEELLGQSGITPETTIVLYGDTGNAAAAWALWQLRLRGHPDARLLEGGSERWAAEGRAVAIEEPEFRSTVYFLPGPGDPSARVLLDEVRLRVADRRALIADARGAAEFAAGHIPGARHVPAELAAGPAAGLAARLAAAGIDGTRPVIVYSGAGYRASLLWLALTAQAGYQAAHYDGAWLEWSSLIGAPIERGGGAER